MRKQADKGLQAGDTFTFKQALEPASRSGPKNFARRSMSWDQKQKQLSLLDLEPPSGEPTQREMLYWETWNKQRYQRLVQEFQQQYQESPILRRGMQERNLDLYMTHPSNAYLVDQDTGELIQERKLLHRVWGMDISPSLRLTSEY
ncbi:MAG: hypothetical protein U5L00_17605 [Desulfovermiculus sp.]|nr:hypothetical protein [Desulfovermiculus sp.]